MSNDTDHQNYRISQLERKVEGLQKQVGILHAKHDGVATKHERRIRDLEIRDAVKGGASQKRVAQVYHLSAARVNQIVRKSA